MDALRPALGDAELIDFHTHIGANDPDGFRCAPGELTAALELAGARGAVFAMHEPDGYGPANDAVLAAAEASEGRLFAFCRVDPNAGALAEARRCLDAGARGVKLHPRAEGFTLDHPAVGEVCELAAARGVPVLTHAGRGIPSLGKHAVELTGRLPELRLVLAHAAITDLSWIWAALPERPNLLIDTSWWNPIELVALMAVAPPGQILMASDAPYGTPLGGAVLALRCAINAGLTAKQVRAIAGGQARRLLEGEPPLDLGPPPGAGPPPDPLLERLASQCIAAVGRAFGGEDFSEPIALARLGCRVPEGDPRAPVTGSVDALLALAEHALRERVGPQGLRFASAVHAVVIAATVARCPAAPLPADVEAVG